MTGLWQSSNHSFLLYTAGIQSSHDSGKDTDSRKWQQPGPKICEIILCEYVNRQREMGRTVGRIFQDLCK